MNDTKGRDAYRYKREGTKVEFGSKNLELGKEEGGGEGIRMDFDRIEFEEFSTEF